MIKLYIRNCTTFPDPLTSPDIMSGLTDSRKENILKLKNEPDRKRSLMAGIMIRDGLKAYGVSQEDVRYTDNGRPYVDGLDFNVSHSGDYVVMVVDSVPVPVSTPHIGCDIEKIRDRNIDVAKRCFSEAELEWINNSPDTKEAFYRIWTARESYAKMTGEGILLDFKRYEVKEVDSVPVRVSTEDVKKMYGDVPEVDSVPVPMSTMEVLRDGKPTGCTVHQWLYNNDYIISICSEVFNEQK